MAEKFPGDPAYSTLEELRVWAKIHIEDGIECPVCTQHAKIYKRHVNSSMACVLILMRGYFAQSPAVRGEWLHTPSFIDRQYQFSAEVRAAIRGDVAKLRYWELIERKPGKRKDSSPRQGYWRITDLGNDFAAGKVRLPKYIYIFNEKIVQISTDETAGIHEALNHAFDYAELMRPSAARAG